MNSFLWSMQTLVISEKVVFGGLDQAKTIIIYKGKFADTANIATCRHGNQQVSSGEAWGSLFPSDSSLQSFLTRYLDSNRMRTHEPCRGVCQRTQGLLKCHSWWPLECCFPWEGKCYMLKPKCSSPNATKNVPHIQHCTFKAENENKRWLLYLKATP